MKILKSILVTLGVAACIPGQAQTFIPPSAPEVAYPDAASNIVKWPDHVSNYGFFYNEGSLSGNFYAYSWSNSDNSDSHTGSISCLFTDPANSTVYDQHTILVYRAHDIEVGTIDVGSTKYVVASYYNNKGVFLNVYKYSFGSGLTPVIMEYLLSKTGKLPRIDSHKGYAIGITWQDEKGIMVAAIDNFGGLNISNPLLIASTKYGTIPDVAFGHEPNLNVRIAYYDSYKATINVIYRDFFDIISWSTSPIGFTLEDVSKKVKARYIDLDCPDHFEYTRWAYVYDNGSNRIIARSYSSDVAVTPFDFEITDPSIYKFPCRKPSIAYSNDSKFFNVAWSNDPTVSPHHHILGVIRDIAGGYVTPYANYLLVANDTKYGKHAYVALSKSNEHNEDLFTVYSMHPGNDEMRYKFKPYGSSTFRGEDIVANNLPFLYPNPFEETLHLNIDGISSEEIIELKMVDIAGRTITSVTGDINNVNTALLNVGSNLQSGVYIIHIYASGKLSSFNVVRK